MTDEELGLLEHITYIDKNVLKVAYPKSNQETFIITDDYSVGEVLEKFDKEAKKTSVPMVTKP